MSALRRFGAGLAAPLILLALVSPAMAGGDRYARDEFNSISYSGTDGSMGWSGSWRETPLTDGPAQGEIRVSADSGCVAGNCLRIGPGDMTGRGVYREVDLTGASGATLSFALRSTAGADSGGRLDVAVSTDGWSWDEVAGIDVGRLDSEIHDFEFDLSAWSDSPVRIGFFGAGSLDGYVLVDNVTVDAFVMAPGLAMDFSTGPSLDPIADETVAEFHQLRVTARATDPDLPNDVLRFSLVDGPAGAAISPGGTVTWTPGETDGPGTHTITVRVEDASGAVSQASFEVTVTEVNSAPEIGFIPDQAMAPGDVMMVTVAVADPDLPANSLSFSATGLPTGVTIARNTGVISGEIPAATAATSGIATVTVTDDGAPAASDSRSFTWQITLGNRSPLLEPIGEPFIGADGVVRFVVSASDADGDDGLGFWLTEGIDRVPEGASIDATTGVFTWQPAESQYGQTYRFNVGVSDSGSPRLSDTQLVTIALPEFNHAPEVEAIADVTSAEGDSIRFPVNVADRDDDHVAFSATNLPPGVAINPTSGFVTGDIDYSAGAGSPYRVTVTVADDGSPVATSSVTFNWVIEETNQPPAMNPVGLIALVDRPLQIVLEASDPDGDALDYEISSGPSFGTLTGTLPNLTYTAAAGDRDEFIVSISDGELSIESTVTIEIRGSNEAPVATVDEYTVPVDGTITEVAPGVLGNDSDPDGNPLVATLVAAPDQGELILNEDGSFIYTPDAGYTGPDKFTYAAVDDMAEQTSATVVLNVVSSEAAGVDSLAAGSGFRSTVLGATTPLWQAPEASGGVVPRFGRAFVSAMTSGISSLPRLAAPFLLLIAALALALTVGKVSLLPAGAGKTQGEGVVAGYDKVRGFGRISAEDDGEPIYVHAAAIEEGVSLSSGRRVEFIAADIKGRRIAMNVWPT